MKSSQSPPNLVKSQVWKKMEFYEAGYTIWLHCWRDFWQKVNFCCRAKRDLTLVTPWWNHRNLLQIWSNLKFEKKMEFYEAGYTIWLHCWRDFWQKVNFFCRTKRDLTLVTLVTIISPISFKCEPKPSFNANINCLAHFTFHQVWKISNAICLWGPPLLPRSRHYTWNFQRRIRFFEKKTLEISQTSQSIYRQKNFYPKLSY